MTAEIQILADDQFSKNMPSPSLLGVNTVVNSGFLCSSYRSRCFLLQGCEYHDHGAPDHGVCM